MLAVAVAVLVVKVRAGAPSVAVGPADLAHAGSRAPAPAASADRPRIDARGPRSSGIVRPAEPPAPADDVGEAAAEEAGSVAEKMVEANRLYDRGDYEGASREAEEILKQQPDNVKMLRIATSSACILGDAAAARAHFEKLPESDQEQIARRCRRYGVEF